MWRVKLREQRVEIPAPDGEIQAIIIEPVGTRSRRGVLYYTDIFQLTESTLRTARQLASAGFLVCLPEIYPREFAGVALDGSAIQIDYMANRRYYGGPGVMPGPTQTGQASTLPPSASRLTQRLASYSARAGGVMPSPVAGSVPTPGRQMDADQS